MLVKLLKVFGFNNWEDVKFFIAGIVIAAILMLIFLSTFNAL